MKGRPGFTPLCGDCRYFRKLPETAVYVSSSDGMNYVFDIINDLPTINPAKWIPVSERLPEIGQSVLMSVGKGMYTAEGFLKDNGKWAQYRWSANLDNVDAWAEMPEPWKGEER